MYLSLKGIPYAMLPLWLLAALAFALVCAALDLFSPFSSFFTLSSPQSPLVAMGSSGYDPGGGPSPPRSYLVVGAGVFGSSLALHLIQKYPDAHVALVDRSPFPPVTGASWDWNKVIRADYGNPLYMELALEALNIWRDEPLWSQFYHQSGLVWVDNKGLPKTVIENYEKLGAKEKYRLIDPSEARQLWGGLHDDANYDDVTDILLNESSGWAEASRALAKAIETAIEAGVQYKVLDIDKVLFDDQHVATGVQAKDGTVLSADRVILATGSMTAKVLADSAPQRKEMQIGKRLVAAAITEGTIKIPEDELDKVKPGPVFIHEVGNVLGGCIPPNADNQIKFYRDVSFTNTVFHEASGQNISVPPDREDYGQWELSPGMNKEGDLVIEGIFGKKSADWKLETGRICWDAITPTQDPIICAHPHAQNLYIMTGGSFHSWKFLPTIGKYALQMMEGTLDERLAKTWAWDREDKGSAHEGLLPHREMKDV